MRYLVGTLSDLTKVRAALDKLAGMPFPIEAIPSPPRAATYSPGAMGWMEHVLEPPLDVGDGTGILRASDDVLPYVGQSTELDGETVTIPGEESLLERDALSPELRAWLDNYEFPPHPSGREPAEPPNEPPEGSGVPPAP